MKCIVVTLLAVIHVESSDFDALLVFKKNTFPPLWTCRLEESLISLHVSSGETLLYFSLSCTYGTASLHFLRAWEYEGFGAFEYNQQSSGW